MTTPIEEQYRTTAQLLRMARKDPDAVSAFGAGTRIEDTQEAILVIKGNKKIRQAISLLTACGLMTSNPVNPTKEPK